MSCISVIYDEGKVMGEKDVGQAEWVRSAVAQYGGVLARYALLHTGNRELAEDVVQETFARLCSENPQRLNSHLAQWLFTVCRNRSLDIQRKQRRVKSLNEDHFALCVDNGSGPDARAQQKDEFDEILNLLVRLPVNQQEVLRLKFQSGLSYKEISSVTGLSMSNVGFLMHSAIKTIRRELNIDEEKSKLNRKRGQL
jgi:RNA polymerase sigma-70 factor (ECF subfamily)